MSGTSGVGQDIVVAVIAMRLVLEIGGIALVMAVAPALARLITGISLTLVCAPIAIAEMAMLSSYRKKEVKTRDETWGAYKTVSISSVIGSLMWQVWFFWNIFRFEGLPLRTLAISVATLHTSAFIACIAFKLFD